MQDGITRQDRPSFSHGDMVGGVETGGCQVSEGADHLTVIQRPDGITAVLDQPEPSFPGKVCDGFQIKGHPEGVGQKNGFCPPQRNKKP